MTDDIPDADDISIPSSVVEQEANAEAARKKARDYTPNGDLRDLIEEWRERGVVDPYGMNWNFPADELQEVIDE